MAIKLLEKFTAFGLVYLVFLGWIVLLLTACTQGGHFADDRCEATAPFFDCLSDEERSRVMHSNGAGYDH